ncbi:MAG: LPS export ABC transporter periplasmic protein LptC, partial [Acidobacteriota bacterium]|nr:LPS export ABC transporter periplasmic protein LptC [Acidobacteriota bacterium]
ELEKVDLTAFGEKQKDGSIKKMRIVSDRGAYTPDQSLVVFDGNVKVTSSDGMEVLTESLKYEQQNEVASTEAAVQFKQGEVSGSSVGAQLYTKTRNLALLKEARVVSTNPDPNKKGGQPVEIRSDKANYSEGDGVLRFEGNASVVQGEKLARADSISGVINAQTKLIQRVEMRGNSFLKSQEKTRSSELQSRDMDFYFDEVQHLKLAVAIGTARAASLEKDSPREILAEKIEAFYASGEKESLLQSVVTQGRTTMKIEVAEGAPNSKEVSERMIEADAVNAVFREDGVNMARAEASGNAVLTITPKTVKPISDRQKLRAVKFTADFFQKGNAIKTFLADGNAVAEFEPLESKTKRSKRTVTGKKLTANLVEQTQDIEDLTVEGGAKFVETFPAGSKESDRNATADRAIYTASNQTVAMRGKPLLWDSTSRANADEIDANVETGESFLRGRVRTTYYSREKTGGAAPFKKDKAPVTIVSDRAAVKHNEGAARYTGNVRAWQDSDFIRADNMELDNGEKLMTAWGNAQSAFYDFEREVEKNRKEVVPVFATADKIVYSDANHTAHYEGAVKIKQGTDQIDSAVADALMDDKHKLVQLTASNNVVMTQPSRRATGDHVVYTSATDTAILTAAAGKLAVVEDKEREAVTKSEKLTLHLRDARIEAGSESGSKKRVKTTHRIQNGQN